MRRLYPLIALGLLTGCHILFPFEATTPAEDLSRADGARADMSPMDATPDGPAGERQPDLALPIDGQAVDAPPPLDLKPPDGPASADAAPPPGWSAMTSGVSVGLYAVWGLSASSVFAVGSNGTVLHWGGSGKSWTKVNGATMESLWAICRAPKSSKILAAGSNGTVVQCDATACAKVPVTYAGSAPGLTGCSCVSATSCYLSAIRANSLQGDLYELKNGNTMVKRYGGTMTGQLHGVWAAPSPVRVYAAGNGGTLIRFDGSYIEAKPFIAELKEAWGVAADDVFVVGAAATIPSFPFESTLLRYSAGKWSKISPTKTKAPLYGVWGSGPGDVYAVGAQGTILRFNGSQVTSIPASTTGAGTKTLWAIWGSSASDIFVAGSSGMILRYH